MLGETSLAGQQYLSDVLGGGGVWAAFELSTPERKHSLHGTQLGASLLMIALAREHPRGSSHTCLHDKNTLAGHYCGSLWFCMRCS